MCLPKWSELSNICLSKHMKYDKTKHDQNCFQDKFCKKCVYQNEQNQAIFVYRNIRNMTKCSQHIRYIPGPLIPFLPPSDVSFGYILSNSFLFSGCSRKYASLIILISSLDLPANVQYFDLSELWYVFALVPPVHPYSLCLQILWPVFFLPPPVSNCCVTAHHWRVFHILGHIFVP